MIVITISGFLKIISKIFFYIATKNLWILNLFNVQLKFQQCYSLLSVSITPLRSLIASPKTSDKTHSKKSNFPLPPHVWDPVLQLFPAFFVSQKNQLLSLKSLFAKQAKTFPTMTNYAIPWTGLGTAILPRTNWSEVKKNPSTSAQQPQHKHGRAHTIIHLGEWVVNKHIMLMLAN